VIIAVVIFAAIAFFIIALNTGDLLWFYPKFEELPVSIVVHCYGEDVLVNPGESAYTTVNSAINETLSGSKRWDSLSLSEATFNEYQTSPNMLVLFLSYDPPVRVHSMYKFFKSLDTIIIPLDGRHAAYNTFFGRARGFPVAGSLHTNTIAPILTALDTLGLCQKR
jgi:hypothetical protein